MYLMFLRVHTKGSVQGAAMLSCLNAQVLEAKGILRIFQHLESAFGICTTLCTKLW